MGIVAQDDRYIKKQCFTLRAKCWSALWFRIAKVALELWRLHPRVGVRRQLVEARNIGKPGPKAEYIYILVYYSLVVCRHHDCHTNAAFDLGTPLIMRSQILEATKQICSESW